MAHGKPRHGAEDAGAAIFRPVPGLYQPGWSHGSRHGLFSVALPGWNGVCKYSLRVDLLDFRPIPQSPHFCVAQPRLSVSRGAFSPCGILIVPYLDAPQ